MINTPMILWLDWFDSEKANRFREITSNIWGLLVRNSMTSIFCKKWLREEISRSAKNEDISNLEIMEAEEKWIADKNITKENFEENREAILRDFKLTENDFLQYCRNEIMSRKWARSVWISSVPQIFLEKKDEFDKIKLEMLSAPEKNKGLILEIYQILKEKESDFTEIGNRFTEIKYMSNKKGTWFKKSEIRKEIRFAAEKLKKGEYSKPIRIDERLIIIGLIDVVNAKLDKTIEESIVEKELEKFIRYGIEQLEETGMDK